MVEAEKPSLKSKKLLENSLTGNMMVPLAILIVGALIVFGVTKMLSSNRSYKDLVREMHSKTFGNRWIAAYELSKIISTNGIPAEEMPWMVENLEELYAKARDPRSRDFIVVALGALKTEKAYGVLVKALEDPEPNVKFHAIVALSSLPLTQKYDLEPVVKFLQSDDKLLKQASILTLATHRVSSVENEFVKLLNYDDVFIKYSAATALINYQNEAAIPYLKSILALKKENSFKLTIDQLYSLKLNVFEALSRMKWPVLNDAIKEQVEKEEDLRVVALARDYLNQLKN